MLPRGPDRTGGCAPRLGVVVLAQRGLWVGGLINGGSFSLPKGQIPSTSVPPTSRGVLSFPTHHPKSHCR